MTWVTLPLPRHGSLSREQRTVQTLCDGDECRVRLADGSEAEATWIDGRGWRDEDGEPIEQVAAVWVRPAGGASGKSGTTLSDEQRAERGIGRLNLRISQAAINKLDRDAKRIGCSRAKLIETLIQAAK